MRLLLVILAFARFTKVTVTITLADLRDGRCFISVEEFSTLPGSPSRGNSYEAVRSGVIPSLRLGSRILIPVPALLRVLGAEPAGEVGDYGSGAVEATMAPGVHEG